MKASLYVLALACLPIAAKAQIRTRQEAKKLVYDLMSENLPCLIQSERIAKGGVSYSFHELHTPECWGGMGDPNTSPLYASFWVDKEGVVWRENFALFLRYPVGKYTKDVKIITQIDTWQHPTKAVLERYGIALQKVMLYADETYPIFEAEIPESLRKDARRMEQFRADLLKANGGWACSVWQEDAAQFFIRGKQK